MFSIDYLCLAVAAYTESHWLLTGSRYMIPYVYPIAVIFQTKSVWFTTVMTTYRFAGIKHPLASQKLNTVENARNSISETPSNINIILRIIYKYIFIECCFDTYKI